MTINLTINPSMGSISAVSLNSLADIFGNTPSGFISPADFANIGGNNWQYAFAGTSVSYNFTYALTTSGGIGIGVFSGTTQGVVGYQGRYINSTILNQYLGSINVAIQSDADSTGQSNSLAIQQCIMGAEDECDGIISPSPNGRMCEYNVPLNFGTNSINAALQRVLCQLAGADLYDKRMLVSSSKKSSVPWGNIRDRAIKWLRSVANGDVSLPGAATTSVCTAPTGGFQTVDPVGRRIAPNGAPLYPFGWSFGTFALGQWWGAGFGWWA
jgi:hypothetical protein